MLCKAELLCELFLTDAAPLLVTAGACVHQSQGRSENQSAPEWGEAPKPCTNLPPFLALTVYLHYEFTHKHIVWEAPIKANDFSLHFWTIGH